jgi:hypothetical protein
VSRSVDAVVVADEISFEPVACQVCNDKPSIGVACGSCGPVPFAYCADCLACGAEPFDWLVAYLGCAGIVSDGAANAHYLPIIEATCRVAGKTIDEFWVACAHATQDSSS